jgi:hypothetical protein
VTTRRFFTNTDGGTTLSAGINSSVTSVTVNNAGSFPASTPFTAVIEHGTANTEVVLVTAVASNTLTITRGYDSTTAVSHSSGVAIRSEVVALDLNEASAHTSSNSGVHGAAGSVVGTTDSQTLTNKTLTSPTLSNPTATGTLTAATVTASGAISTASTLAVTGAATAASFGGVLLPKSYANEAAAGAQAAGAVVYLSAPTTTGYVAGNFQSLGGGTWVPVIAYRSQPILAAAYYRNAAFTVAASAVATDIVFDTKDFDYGGTNLNVANGVFTAPVAGLYKFSWSVQAGTGSGAIDFFSQITDSANAVLKVGPRTLSRGMTVGDTFTFYGEVNIPLAASDTAKLRCVQTGAAVATGLTGATISYLQIELCK